MRRHEATQKRPYRPHLGRQRDRSEERANYTLCLAGRNGRLASVASVPTPPPYRRPVGGRVFLKASAERDGMEISFRHAVFCPAERPSLPFLHAQPGRTRRCTGSCLGKGRSQIGGDVLDVQEGHGGFQVSICKRSARKVVFKVSHRIELRYLETTRALGHSRT